MVAQVQVVQVQVAFLLLHRLPQKPDLMDDNHLELVVILHSMLFWGRLKDLEIIMEQ